ncbi:LysM peptidoglycan-binding domain-containing protein, partial [Micromonospora sp. NPDC050200]|uniref:LysM peptidoglycan-binding domain-containing protein n=1 Tax=Micromonospora sp. NPDC050200 TaxID=3155664 RepID=UPI003404CEBC
LAALLLTTCLAHLYRRCAQSLRWLPAVRLPGPLQGLTAALMGATAVTATAATAAAAAAPPTGSVDTTEHLTHTTTKPALTGGAPSVAPTPRGVDLPTHTVRRGDSLSSIAAKRLGDDHRWPDIYALNRGSRFSQGGTLRDPDLIHPGWKLRLPADAAPPARSHPRPPDDAPPPSRSDADAASRAPHQAPPRPTPAVTTPGPQQPPAPAPTATAAADGSAAAVPAPATPAGDAGSPAATGRPAGPASHGVRLPSGSWVDPGLAVAIAAAVALVWAHRRRRYVPREPSAMPRPHDPSLAPMPRVVRQIRRGLRIAAAGHSHPFPPTRPQPAETDHRGIDDQHQPIGAVHDSGSDAAGLNDPDLDHDALPAGPSGVADGGLSPWATARDNPLSALWAAAGMGLTGPGAQAAARGLLTAALASGG